MLGGAVAAAAEPSASPVTMNQDLVSQIKDDLKDFEIGDVKFITIPPCGAGSRHLIFDESRSIKNQSQQEAGRAVDRAREVHDRLIATPFENPAGARYLDETGVFRSRSGRPRKTTPIRSCGATAFGATPVQLNCPAGYAHRIEWRRSATSDADGGSALNLWRHGVFTSRQIRLRMIGSMPASCRSSAIGHRSASASCYRRRR